MSSTTTTTTKRLSFSSAEHLGMKQLSLDFKPSDNDVICARGKEVYNHEGNRRFRALVKKHLNTYSSCVTKMQKSRLVNYIVGTIREASPNGGFIKKIDERWYAVTDRHAREKTGQTMRDLLHTRYSSSTKAKAKNRQQLRAARLSFTSSSKNNHHEEEELEDDNDDERDDSDVTPPVVVRKRFSLQEPTMARSSSSAAAPPLVPRKGRAASMMHLLRRSNTDHQVIGSSTASALSGKRKELLKRRSLVVEHSQSDPFPLFGTELHSPLLFNGQSSTSSIVGTNNLTDTTRNRFFPLRSVSTGPIITSSLMPPLMSATTSSSTTTKHSPNMIFDDDLSEDLSLSLDGIDPLPLEESSEFNFDDSITTTARVSEASFSEAVDTLFECLHIQ